MCVQSPELLLYNDKFMFQISSVTAEASAQSAQTTLGPVHHRASSGSERAPASQTSVPVLLPTSPLPYSAARVGVRAAETEGSRLLTPSSLFPTQPSEFPPPPPRPTCPGEGAVSGAAQLPQDLLQAGGPSQPQGRGPSVLG